MGLSTGTNGTGQHSHQGVRAEARELADKLIANCNGDAGKLRARIDVMAQEAAHSSYAVNVFLAALVIEHLFIAWDAMPVQVGGDISGWTARQQVEVQQ